MSRPLSPLQQPDRLTVRVGVVGHRTDKLLACGWDEPLLRNAVRMVLNLVAEEARRLCYQYRDEYDNHRGPQLHLLSALAEGSDRLVADEALASDFQLQCALPFSRSEYEKDFEDPESRSCFANLLGRATAVLELDGDPQPQARPTAYEAAGRTVLRHCDLLIAVWDGGPSQGVGGTAQMVAEALLLSLPVVWIRAQSPHVASLWEASRTEREPPREADVSQLPARLRRLFNPPGGSEARHYLDFHTEISPRWRPGAFFEACRNLCIGRWRIPRVLPLPWSEGKGWRAFAAARPAEAAAIGGGYLASFRRADELAEFYVGKYRSSFTFTYLAGAAAVLVALLGLLSAGIAAWFIGELALILLILALIGAGHRGRWHQRWLDYRLLAEGLRQMMFLAPLGRVPASFQVPAHLQASDPRSSWAHWSFRNRVRATGLTPARLDDDYLPECRSLLAQAIGEQIRYHSGTEHSYRRLCKHLHVAGKGLFLLAAIGCALHLLLQFIGAGHGAGIEPRTGADGLTTALYITAIALPAFAAALAAILHQGDFERIATRSGALALQLDRLLDELKAARPNSRELGRIADRFSELMLAEIVDWRFVFLAKDLELPA